MQIILFGPIISADLLLCLPACFALMSFELLMSCTWRRCFHLHFVVAILFAARRSAYLWPFVCSNCLSALQLLASWTSRAKGNNLRNVVVVVVVVLAVVVVVVTHLADAKLKQTT